MNILLLNGSPKGEKSNTLRLANAFIDGLNAEYSNQTTSINISKAKIEHCLGCYCCWEKTPGKCIIKDDVADLLEKYINADLIIWSLPLYYHSMPSKIKAFMDRLLPLSLPQIVGKADGTSAHAQRYDLSEQKHVLISTCGFYSIKDNYEGLFQQFETSFGDRLSKIICPEGELFRIPQLAARTDEYLSYVRQAGKEFAEATSFTVETQTKLNELLFPPEVFNEMANASWDIKTDENGETNDTEKTDGSLKFMRQMAAVYNPESYMKDIIIEISFTDLDKKYQLLLGKEKCALKTEDFTTPTTKIETSFATWMKISEGKMNGAEAMMNKEYRVSGDFSTMLKMEEYFGKKRKSEGINSGHNGQKSKTEMKILLFQWILLWVFLPINPVWGGVAGILGASLVPLAAIKYKLTIYDRASAVLVSALSLSALLAVSPVFISCLSYSIFGVMWLVSCLSKIPLTAYYSCNKNGEEKAFTNPIFMRTNKILTLLWGILYLVMSASVYFLLQSPFSSYVGFITSLLLAPMGFFTAWFSGWYPAKIARG